VRRLLHQVSRFAGRREVKFSLVDLKIDGNAVIHADHDAMIGVLDFNDFAIGGDIEVLYDFKDDVADLVFRIVVYDSKPGLFRDFVV
jgi:hypothetical protein